MMFRCKRCHSLIRSLIRSALYGLSLTGLTFAGPAFSDLDASIADEGLLFGDIPSVFTASKYEQKVTEAPARVSIITANEIQRLGHRTLVDVLNALPGFQMTYDRSYNYIGNRGFNIPGDFNTRILLLIDGHRVNENIYNGMLVDQGMVVDIDLINRVEVVRGPASSLYGSSAFFGVINVITKRGRDLKGTELSLAAGSFNSVKGRLTYGNRFDNDVELLVSVSGYESDGDDLYYPEFDDPSTNNGVAEDANDAEAKSLNGKLSYGDFTLAIAYAESETGIPTASYGAIFNDSRTRTTEGHAYIDLKYQTLLKNETDITARLFYDEYWYDGDWAYDYADPGDPPDEVVFKEHARGDWWGTEAQATQTWFDKHRLTLGAEYRDSLKEEQDAYDIYDVYLDINTDTYVWAAYLQDEFQLSDDLILNMGVRYTDSSNSDSSVNPRIAAIWALHEATTLKFLYGSAFRAPNAYELHYHDGDSTQKAPDGLDPETIDTYEVILEQVLNRELRVVASIFHNDLQDLISLSEDPSDNLLVFENIDEATTEGAELELIAQYDQGLAGAASYSYQQAEDDTGARLVNSARHIAKFSVIAPLAGEDFSAGLEWRYESGRKTLSGDETDDRFITNLTLISKNWVEGLTASASVYDLFNEAPSDPGFQEHDQDQIEQDGRTFRLKFDYTL